MSDGLLLGGIGFAITILLILIEVPVGIAIGLVAISGIMLMLGLDATVSIGATTVWDSLTNYTLTMLPLFILMGNLASESGLSSRLYSATRTLIGHRRGGLALATVGASAGFGMISGSSLATTATMSRIAIPEMRKAGYSDTLSSGVAVAGGTLGILIPPSTILVIYAFLAEQSIKKMLLATGGPIVIAILLYALAILIPLALNMTHAPRLERAGKLERLKSLREIIPPTCLFLLIMGGLYSGFFTANETASVGVAAVLIYGILSRRLSLRGALRASLDTALTCGALYLMLVAANLFNSFLALSGLPFALTSFFGGAIENPLIVILIMSLIYIIMGTVMDSMAMLLLTVPLFVPIADAAGIDLIWFGIYVVLMVELGLITPPVGMNLFVLKATVSDLKIQTIWQGAIPFVLADLIRIAILVAFPVIVLWLPNAAL